MQALPYPYCFRSPRANLYRGTKCTPPPRHRHKKCRALAGHAAHQKKNMGAGPSLLAGSGIPRNCCKVCTGVRFARLARAPGTRSTGGPGVAQASGPSQGQPASRTPGSMPSQLPPHHQSSLPAAPDLKSIELETLSCRVPCPNRVPTAPDIEVWVMQARLGARAVLLALGKR